MEQQCKRDFFGYILKKEQLESFNEGSQINASVLVASNPFPGLEHHKTINIYYLIIEDNKLDNNEDLIRVTQNINRNYAKNLDACPCELTIYNKIHKAIRIYNCQASELNAIIELYKTYGLVFQKKQTVTPFTSLIKLHKYFELVSVGEGIFQSDKDAQFCYFKILHKLSWEEFDHIVSQVKIKGEYQDCDFALAVFYSKTGIEDFIRIYTDHCSVDRQKEFQAYLYESIKTLTLK